MARTWKVWAPNESGTYGVWLAPGPEQRPNGWESRRHWNLEAGSLDVNLKVGLGVVVWTSGPAVIVVSGRVESSTYFRAAEHGDLFPAASVAVARNEVVVLLATETISPGEWNWDAVPEATGAPVQCSVVYSLIVEGARAKPLTRGWLLLAGELGVVPLMEGAGGALESSTYARGFEQGEVFPAASVAVARNEVVELSGTETPNPVEWNLLTRPETNGVPVQPATL
jgi:hypothetical protein